MVIEQGVKATQKKPVKKKKSNAGRPSVIDDSVVSKLEEGFSRGLTDTEACLYANISRASLFRYIEANPEFGNRKEELKDMPKMKAKLVVTDKINDKDDYNSRWYLERKSKDEFSTKEIIDQTTKQITYTQDEWDNMDDETLDKIINSEK